MANAFDVLESMRQRTQLMALEREDFGGLRLSSAEVRPVPTPMFPQGPVDPVLTAKSGLPGLAMSYVCEGGESSPATSGGETRFAALSGFASGMSASQGDRTAMQLRVTGAPFASPSGVVECANGRHSHPEFLHPDSGNEPGPVAPASAHQHSAPGCRSSSGSGITTGRGQLPPFGSTVVPGGWRVASSGPSQPAGAGQGGPTQDTFVGQGASVPHGPTGTLPHANGDSAVLWKEVCRLAPVQPTGAPQPPQLNQQCQCPNQQQYQLAAQDRTLQQQQYYGSQQQLHNNPNHCNVQQAQLAGPADWQQQQQQQAQQGPSASPQQAQALSVPQQQQTQQQVQLVQNFGLQAQMQGAQASTDSQGRRETDSTPADAHRQPGVQALLAPYGQAQSVGHMTGLHRQQHQQHHQHAVGAQPCSGSVQAVAASKSQINTRSSMLSSLATSVRDLAAASTSQLPASTHTPPQQPPPPPLRQQQAFAPAGAQLPGCEEQVAARGVTERFNSAAGSYVLPGYQQSLSMCPGPQQNQQLGAQTPLPATQGLQMHPGPQPYLGPQAQQNLLEMRSPEAQVNPQALMLRLGSQVAPLQPRSQVVQVQPGRQGQSGEEAVPLQTGPQGPEVCDHDQYKSEPIFCQQPHQEQLQQACRASTTQASQRVQMQSGAQEWLMAQQQQSDIAEKFNQVEQRRMQQHSQQQHRGYLPQQTPPISTASTAQQQRQAQEQLLRRHMQQQFQCPQQQAQLLLQMQQQQWRQDEERQRQDDQRPLQQVLMQELPSLTDWQQGRTQAHAPVQLMTEDARFAPQQACQQLRQSFGRADMVAQQQLGQEQVLQQLTGGQRLQGYIRSLPNGHEAPACRQELGERVPPCQVQRQAEWIAEKQGSVQVQEPPVQEHRQTEQRFRGPSGPELQGQQQGQLRLLAQQGKDSWWFAPPEPQPAQLHPLAAGGSLLQPTPSRSSNGGCSRACMQDGLPDRTGFGKAQSATLEAPPSSSSSRQQTSSCPVPSGAVPQSLQPSVPANASSRALAAAVSSGTSPQHLQQQEQWLAEMSSAQQVQLQASMQQAWQHQPCSGDSVFMATGGLRRDKFSGAASDPQSLLQSQLLLQQQQYRMQPPPPLLQQQQDAAQVNPGFHGDSNGSRRRGHPDIRSQLSILDYQLQPQQQQHQLSGQDSCATPDGAGQEEVEAVPHATATAMAATPTKGRAGAACRPDGTEAVLQQQDALDGLGLVNSLYSERQLGQWPMQQTELQQQQHLGQLHWQGTQLRQQEGQDVDTLRALTSEALYNRQSQVQDQLQRGMGQLMQQPMEPQQLSQQPAVTGPQMLGQQQKPKPSLSLLPFCTSSEAAVLLQGRPLLPLFKQTDKKSHAPPYEAEHPQHQQQQHQPSLLAALSKLPANVSAQQLTCMYTEASMSKAATTNPGSVLGVQPAHPVQLPHQGGLTQQVMQQSITMASATPQPVAAPGHPAALIAAGRPTATSGGSFYTYVNPPILGSEESGLTLPPEQQHPQQQQWQLLQQLQHQHQLHQLQQLQHCKQQQNVDHLALQAGQQGVAGASGAAGVMPHWSSQGMGSFALGTEDARAAPARSPAVSAAAVPGAMPQLSLKQVFAEVLRIGRSGAGQVQPFQQQQQLSQKQVVSGQGLMAPRPQYSSCSTPMQQQNQQQAHYRNDFHQPQQENNTLPQQHQEQKLQDVAAAATVPAIAQPLPSDRRSWASGPTNATLHVPAGAFASGTVGPSTSSSLLPGQDSAQVLAEPCAATAIPATMGPTTAPGTPWGGCRGAIGGDSSGSSSGGAANLEPLCKRTKREADPIALQPRSMETGAEPWLCDPAGSNTLNDAGKSAVAAAIELVDQLIAPKQGLRTSSSGWASPQVLSAAPGYESSSETNPRSVRKAMTPRAPCGYHRYQHPQSSLLDQQYHINLQRQMLSQQLLQQRRRSQLGGRRSQGVSGGGPCPMAAVAAPFLPPLPPPALLSPVPGAVAASAYASAITHCRQWSSEDENTGAAVATPLQPPAMQMASGLTAAPPPPLRRRLQTTPQKAAAAPPPPEEGCARSRPIDMSKLGQHRLKPPPVIHPLRPGSRLPLVATGLRGAAARVLGGIPLAAPLWGGTPLEDAAADGALVPYSTVAAATAAGAAAGSGKRLAVKDRKVPVELVPVVGKAMGAGAGGVRLKRDGGAGAGRCGGDGQSAATGKLLNALREAKARLNRRFVVRRSGIAQLGVFATERIPADTLLMEYHGEAVRTTVADLREKRYAAAGLGCYLFNPGGLPDEAVVLDATHRGNIMRFVNHSCGPNCGSKTVVIEGQRRIFLFSLIELLPGTELTYDYKLSSALCMDAFKGLPEEYIEQAAEQIGVELLLCQCAHERCRKYL